MLNDTPYRRSPLEFTDPFGEKDPLLARGVGDALPNPPTFRCAHEVVLIPSRNNPDIARAILADLDKGRDGTARSVRHVSLQLDQRGTH